MAELCASLTVQEEAGGDGSFSGSNNKSTELLLLMRSLKGVIAPSLLYLRDEQADTFKHGKSQQEEQKKK